MAKYDISLKATEDLYDIWEYTVDTWSEDQADKYYGQLVEGMSAIADFPLSMGKSYEEIRPGLRGYHIQKHVIFYMIQSDGGALIVRILHEKMDFSIHFQ